MESSRQDETDFPVNEMIMLLCLRILLPDPFVRKRWLRETPVLLNRMTDKRETVLLKHMRGSLVLQHRAGRDDLNPAPGEQFINHQSQGFRSDSFSPFLLQEPVADTGLMDRRSVAVHFEQAAKALLPVNGQDQGIRQSFVIQAADHFYRIIVLFLKQKCREITVYRFLPGSLRRLSASERVSGIRHRPAPVRTGGSGNNSFILSVRSVYMMVSHMRTVRVLQFQHSGRE